MTRDPQAPQVALTKFAFDHPQTRLDWFRARRRVAARSFVCMILLLVLLVLLSLSATETKKGGLAGLRTVSSSACTSWAMTGTQFPPAEASSIIARR